MTNLEKDKNKSWCHRLKQLFHAEPKNQNDLLHVLREAQHRSLIDAEALNKVAGQPFKIGEILAAIHAKIATSGSNSWIEEDL